MLSPELAASLEGAALWRGAELDLAGELEELVAEGLELRDVAEVPLVRRLALEELDREHARRYLPFKRPTQAYNGRTARGRARRS